MKVAVNLFAFRTYVFMKKPSSFAFGKWEILEGPDIKIIKNFLWQKKGNFLVEF